jgi:K+-sensing histidine kinase KdpD
LLVRLLLSPLLEQQAPLIVFIMPVVVSAWYGGLGPGLLATAICTLIGDYFFVQPAFAFAITTTAEAVRVTIFIVNGVLISILSEALHRVRRRAQTSAHALARSEARFRATFEQAAVGIAQMQQPSTYACEEKQCCLYLERRVESSGAIQIRDLHVLLKSRIMLKRILDQSCLFRHPAGAAMACAPPTFSPRLCTAHPINPSHWDAAKAER